jgi:phosphoserine phosphatase
MDIDGTLLKGFITFEFAEYLHGKKLFKDESYQSQLALMETFKKGKINQSEAVSSWLNFWGEGLAGFKQEEILSAATDFFEIGKKLFFPSSQKLVSKFKDKNYVVVGVSAGAIEMMSLVKDYLGLDYMFASELEVIDGIYSSKLKTNLHDKGGKEMILDKFFKEKDIDSNNSFGFGDSINDLGIFEKVGVRVALNPSNSLLDFAKKNEFIIATKDNVLNLVKI